MNLPDDTIDGEYLEWLEREVEPEPARERGVRKRRRHRVFLWVILLVPLLMLAGFGGYFLYRALQPEPPALLGVWTREMDLSSEAIPPAREWLLDAALGQTIDIPGNMGAIKISLVLTFEADGKAGDSGSWRIALDEASYGAARLAAYDGLASAFRELLALRLSAAGEPQLSDEELDLRVEEATGLPTQEYLLEYGPELLPDLDVLRARYNRTGSFLLTEDGTLVRDGGTPEAFLANEALLVLTEGASGDAEIYRRVGAEDGAKSGDAGGMEGQERENEWEASRDEP